MIRWARGLILATTACVAVASTLILITAASSAASSLPGTARGEQVTAVLEPQLAKALALTGPNERLDIIIEMQSQLDLSDPALSMEGRIGREHLVRTMQAIAEQTQVGIRAFLATRGLADDLIEVNPFWIFNGLAVRGARRGLVQDLASRSDVALIRLDVQRRWISSEARSPDPDASGTDLYLPSRNLEAQRPSVEWGIQHIRADQVWNGLGINGTGVVVANLDTGVDWQHPALRTRYRGYDAKGFHQHAGNWFDATDEGAVYPVDGVGHGTHTMGTIVGGDGIGVAPGARWIAARAFDSDGSAYDSWLHAAFQWLLAPDDNADLAPQVVNNSWGNDVGTLEIFQRDIDALRRAGIFVVFSVGNAGPDPATVGSPASLPGAFAVGASDQDDQVAGFSSRGPSPWGEIRPHVVAPGVNVYSTEPGGAYSDRQGTSMAAPHIAGTAALILSARPGLDITQTAFALTSTAIPFSEVIPDNDFGYGRVDAYAAVAYAAHAGVLVGRAHGDGQPISGAVIRVTSTVSGTTVSATTDSEGRYQLFLRAGYYDLTASAFGYTTGYAHALPVIAGATQVQDFNLTPLPTGHLRGSVTTLAGDPLAAQVSVIGTPATTVTQNGTYRLDLPTGSYTVEARTLGYRVATATVDVTAGEDAVQDYVLPSTLRVVLVDGGSWYYGSQAVYYRQALNDLSYAYDEIQLKHLPGDVPTAADLSPYDLVVWSAPNDSPGKVGAGAAISEYLASGGNLLLSGQDVAYWDGGGDSDAEPYYLDWLHSTYQTDNAPTRDIVCQQGGDFDDITLAIQNGDGADNQNWPDEIEIAHPDHAKLVCSYDEGNGAVVQAGFCSPHRALNLGFGFEAINNAEARAGFLARALDWFNSPRQLAGVELMRQSEPVQIAPPGETVTHTFRLRNMGEAGTGDQIRVELSGADWPTTLLIPTVDLRPCATTTVDVRVDIPPAATWNAFDILTITARSANAPALSQVLTVTSKAPAPVLLVDDDRWYDQAPAYASALDAADVPFDRWEVTDIFGAGSPPAEILARYPIVLWFNGYDWFDPLHSTETPRLEAYLEDGGRLFLSSQNALDYVMGSSLVLDYFGVLSYSGQFTQTSIQGVPGRVLGESLGELNLDYPFDNWSDSVLPAPGSRVAFRGQHGQPAALTREGQCEPSHQPCRWRTAFFAFPVEAIPTAGRTALLSQLVGWLSWLGSSELQSSRAVAQPGQTLAYTLTVRNDGREAVSGATVSNTLPAGTVLVTGPAGGAGYDTLNHRITWAGNLAPGTGVAFTYQLSVTDALSGSVVKNVADIFLGQQSLPLQREAVVWIAAPDLSLSSLTMAAEAAGSSTELTTTLVVRNEGLADAEGVQVDNALPWPLHLVAGTSASSGGGVLTELPQSNRILWEGDVGVSKAVTLSYRMIAPSLLRDDLWLYNAARFEIGSDHAWERGDWLLASPQRFYFPIFLKNG